MGVGGHIYYTMKSQSPKLSVVEVRERVLTQHVGGPSFDPSFWGGGERWKILFNCSFASFAALGTNPTDLCILGKPSAMVPSPALLLLSLCTVLSPQLLGMFLYTVHLGLKLYVFILRTKVQLINVGSSVLPNTATNVTYSIPEYCH